MDLGQLASMRPRGQTPWMLDATGVVVGGRTRRASMRPRGQTPWMRSGWFTPTARSPSFNEATGADPVDAAVSSTNFSPGPTLQ